MDNLTRRTLGITVIFYILAFTVFFSFSIYSFAGINIVGETLTTVDRTDLHMDISLFRNNPDSETQVLSNFKISWIMFTSLGLFIQYLLPVQSAALILAFSLFFPWKLGANGMQMPFVDVISKSIFLFLILTLFFTGLTEGVLPKVLKKQSEQLYLTELAIDYFERADKEIDSGKPDKDLGSIVMMLRSYLQIDPGNPVIKDTLDWAISTMAVKPVVDIFTDEPNTLNKEDGNKAADLIEMAREYFMDEDYFSALYHANLAFDLDPSRQEAQRLAAESREAIRSLEPDQSEREAKKYFELKRTGFNTLKEGNPIEAYYIFKELSELSIDDGDIQEFLERSLKGISDISFFTDAADKYISTPGIDDIVFLENENTLVKIGKMIHLEENQAYFFNIEVMTIDRTGEILRHYTAPYGKFNSKSNSIIMHAIDRVDSGISYKPVYIIGTAKNPDDIILKISPKLNDLRYLGQDRAALRFMNVLELFRLAAMFSNYGYIKAPAQIILLKRILKPFTFLIISFISVSLGWLLRIRKYSFPFLSIILIPIIVYLLNNILSIYEYGIELLLAFSLFKTGFNIALIILAASQAVILFFALASIAGQRE